MGKNTWPLLTCDKKKIYRNFLSIFIYGNWLCNFLTFSVCLCVSLKKKSNRIVVSCHIAQWCELKVGLNFKSSHEDCYAYMASGIIKCRSSWAVTKQFLMQLCQTSYLMTSLWNDSSKAGILLDFIKCLLSQLPSPRVSPPPPPLGSLLRWYKFLPIQIFSYELLHVNTYKKK